MAFSNVAAGRRLAAPHLIRYTAPQSPTLREVMKILVILILIVIVFSLGSALFYLVRDKGQSERTARALTLRVGLSIVLFVILMAGYHLGLIRPSGL